MEDEIGKWRIPGEGLWGFAHCGAHDSWYPWSGAGFAERLKRLVGDLNSSGANTFRPHIHWHIVEPLLSDDLRGPQDVTDEMVARYADGGDGVCWDVYDALMNALASAGIEPHIVVGAAYDFQVPSAGASGAYFRAVPDRLGRDRYLAHLYLHARGAVRRYRDRVHVWQLENELNCAGETMLLVRWRTGRSWLDTGFQTAIMEVLSRAVLEEDPSALRSHNFQCEFRIIPGIYDWRNDVRRWLTFLDIVGVDPYPNYLFGWPSRGRAAGLRVGRALEVSEGRPVMVLESGYPVRPRHRGNSEGRQAEYVRDAIDSTLAAGGSGFYYYVLCSPEGYPVEGPWSNRCFQSIEPWWGLIRRDDSRRPAWFEFQRSVERAKSVAGR